MERWLNDIDRRRKYVEGKVFCCQFFRHKFHTEWLGIEPTPGGEMPATNCLSYNRARKELHMFN
jgi:hypothetical protein